MAESENLSVVKCPNCGADMTFEPSLGALHCEYCDSTKVVDKRIIFDRDFLLERADGEVEAGAVSYECPNCGATVDLENFATTTECPFCGATNIVKKERLKGLKPDAILPFCLPRGKALENGKKWLKKRIFAPTKLKKNFKAEHFKGIYIPSFVFKSNTTSGYEGRLGEDYYVTVRDAKGNSHTEVRTRWFSVRGNYGKAFSNIVVEASSRLEQKDMDKLLPFDLQSAEQYKREYLAGFSAEQYSDSLDNSFATAKSIMDEDLRRSILAQYKHDRVDYLNVYTSYNDTKFNYIMLPVWVCGYKFREKLYTFLVNGRTGASTGKTPISIPKVVFTVLLGLGIISVLVCYFLGLF